jgi:hypothetical protein
MSPVSVPQGLDAAGEDNGAGFTRSRRGPISGVSRATRAINFWGCRRPLINAVAPRQLGTGSGIGTAARLRPRMEQGHFTWKEWADTLADDLKAADNRGESDDGSRYYQYRLAALEPLVRPDRSQCDARAHGGMDNSLSPNSHEKPIELSGAGGQTGQ